MHVQFIDTTFRDGSQSLWASGMRTGMMEAVAEDMDQIGFKAIEVPANGIYFKKIVRDLKEDPWELLRSLGRKMPATPKSCMAGGFIMPFEPPPPRALIELFYARAVGTGAFNRAQLTANTVDQMKRTFPWIIPVFRDLGVQVVLALSYTVSPRHTDAYYAQKTRELLAFKPDAIYVKDQGGLLTVDRVRTLLPAMLENAGGAPIELHSHCTTGLAPLVYLEALRLGVHALHTAVPPLAQGSGQPSVLNIVRNARLMGHSAPLAETLIESVAQRLTAIAKQERLPIGAPLEYDCAQFIHQVPGGVISNLKHQLGEMRLDHRLDEVLEESVRVRKDLGYPIMITPLSQFVVTQAAINVAAGERYKHVIDEVILFAQGVYGEDSGYLVMDENLKDRLLATQRAAELARKEKPDVTMADLRDKLGGPGVSDEEFLLRYIMKGEQEISAMRAAGRPKRYFSAATPLLKLIEELKECRRVRHVSLARGGASLTLRKNPRLTEEILMTTEKRELPEDLAAFRDSYVELFGWLPPLPSARFEFSSEVNPEFLRLSERLRAHAFYSDVFDLKTTQLILFGMLLVESHHAAQYHALAARRAGASWEELHKVVELAAATKSLGPANQGVSMLKALRDKAEIA